MSKVLNIFIIAGCKSSRSLSRRPRLADPVSAVNNIAQTGIMAANLANNIVQTTIMEKQLQQDYELAMLQLQQAQKSSEEIVNAMEKIENRLGDISIKLDQIGGHISIGLQTVLSSGFLSHSRIYLIKAAYKAYHRNVGYQFMIRLIRSMTDS